MLDAFVLGADCGPPDPLSTDTDQLSDGPSVIDVFRELPSPSPFPWLRARAVATPQHTVRVQFNLRRSVPSDRDCGWFPPQGRRARRLRPSLRTRLSAPRSCCRRADKDKPPPPSPPRLNTAPTFPLRGMRKFTNSACLQHSARSTKHPQKRPILSPLTPPLRPLSASPVSVCSCVRFRIRFPRPAAPRPRPLWAPSAASWSATAPRASTRGSTRSCSRRCSSPRSCSRCAASTTLVFV